MTKRTLILAIGLLIPAAASFAHHSFAPFDIRNPITISGVAEKWTYRRPHPQLILVDENDVRWDIEVPVRRWDRAGHAQDAIVAGDQLEVIVFPARTGASKAAMSGFHKEGKFYNVTDNVRQQSGNEAADAIEAGEPLEEVLERYPEPEEGATPRRARERAAENE